ncbi:hypothetical protein Glove_228g42 [Diversispora epigaea]|uniref:Uncharacterized protein n=1 Tax=Diversispora epigaea TaxID=1348612 RepID=A0A397IHZ9_9GLOM|nr:hypothetical protein Glove_228g42 [Diversispora epigaea]
MAKLSTFVFVTFTLFLLSFNNVSAGPLAYALCQTACNAGWCTCYAALGLTAGATTGGVALPAAAITCNIAQGVYKSSIVPNAPQENLITIYISTPIDLHERSDVLVVMESQVTKNKVSPAKDNEIKSLKTSITSGYASKMTCIKLTIVELEALEEGMKMCGTSWAVIHETLCYIDPTQL